MDIEPPKGADVLPPSRQPLQPWRWWSSRLPLRFPKHSDGDTVISIMADASSPWADASCRRRGPLARCSRCAGCGDASREPASAGHRGSRTCQSGHFFRALRTRALLDRSNRCQLVVTAGPRFQSADDKQLAAPVDIEPPKGADVLPPLRQPLQPWRWWSSRLPLRFPKHSDGDTVISIMADASSPWADASCRRRGPLARCSRCAGCGDASREPASAGHRGSRTCQSGHFFRALRTRALLDRSNRCQLVVTAGPRFQSADDKQLAAPVDIEPPKGADVLPPLRQPLQPWRWWSSLLPLRFPKHSDGDTVITSWLTHHRPGQMRRAAAEARSRGARDAQAAATLAESPQVPDIEVQMSLMHLYAIRCQSNPPCVNKGFRAAHMVRLRPSRYRGRVVTCGTEPYG